VAAAEAALKTHAGPYYNRTIVTEYVGASLFMQGITTQMKAYGMGSCYWAGLEGTGGIAKLSGTAPNYTLTVTTLPRSRQSSRVGPSSSVIPRQAERGRGRMAEGVAKAKSLA